MDSIIKHDKVYKVFLVEEDDDDRERVLSALTNNIQVDYEPDYGDIDMLLDSVKIFKTQDNYTLTIKLIPRLDGTYITVEDFSVGNEPEEDDA